MVVSQVRLLDMEHDTAIQSPVESTKVGEETGRNDWGELPGTEPVEEIVFIILIICLWAIGHDSLSLVFV